MLTRHNGSFHGRLARCIKWRACDVGEAKEALLILQPFRHITYVTTHSPTLPLLHLRHSSFANPSFASPKSQALHLISRAHSPTFPSLHLRHPSLYLRHSLFSNPLVASPTSQFIPQPFFCFSYHTTRSSLNEQSSFSKLSFTSTTSKRIVQPCRWFTYVTAHFPTFRCFTYVTVHSLTFPLLHLRHNSFPNPSVASPTSQFILQPFRCFTYVTVHSPTLLSLLLRHKLFT